LPERDISQFLTPVDDVAEDLEDQPIYDAGTPQIAVDLDPVPSYDSPSPDDILAATTVLDASPHSPDEKLDLVEQLTQQLAQQFIKFQVCCGSCH
jgi:hypothetical protein